MDFTLEQMKHMNAWLQGVDPKCEVCDSARKKLEELIAVATLDEIDKGLPIPEWMAKLGVVKREIVKESDLWSEKSEGH